MWRSIGVSSHAWIINWENVIENDHTAQLETGQLVVGDHKLIPIVDSNHAF